MTVLLLTAGCGLSQIKDQEDKYLLARMEYNDLLTEYLALYNEQDPATQLDWKINIDPKWKAVRAALATWKGALKAEEGDPVSAEREWLVAIADVKVFLEPFLDIQEE